MDATCRLCLSVKNENTTIIHKKHDVLMKISKCFSLKITLNKSLPNRACFSCIKKINEIHNFYTKVIENEKKLLYHNSRDQLSNSVQTANEMQDVNIEYRNENIFCETESNDNTEMQLKQENLLSTTIYPNSFQITKKDFDFHCSLCLKSFQRPSLLLEHRVHCIDEKSNIELDIDKYDQSTNKQLVDNKAEKENATKILKEKYETKMTNSNLDNSKCDEKYSIVSSGDQFKFKCNLCEKSFNTKKAVVRHIVSHTNERPFVCNICGRTYKTSGEILRHKRIHKSAELICSYECGYRTSYRGALKTHEKTHQPSQYNYKCETCGKGFQVLTMYKQHQNVHEGLKPFVCSMCGVAFHMDRYLKAHLQNVHNKSTNGKCFICIHCCLPLDSLLELKMHKIEKHGLRTTCLCDVCGKVFKNTERLKNHKTTHSKLKPYTCGVCNKTFAKKFHLKVHENTHTGERKHSCGVCGQSFVQRSSLLRHNKRRHQDLKSANEKLEHNM
ncbi:zinc finger protein 235 isoform X1 [Bombyx mori]|uniref:Uncharacterized protein n=1 Tax=Bombyx mori TaxID=7091 RepID=A0A8R2MA71_BOMMO|nr:zinc finger protein 235 isoform X1 [Bombyx mori]